MSRQPDFFTETAVTPERKVEKWFPRWEINRRWWLWRAGCISQDTYLLYDMIIMVPIPTRARVVLKKYYQRHYGPRR